MHTVDFKSDTYNCVIFEIFHVKYTEISSILYLKTFSVHSGVKCPVLHTLIKNKWHICTLLGYLFLKITYLCTL